MAEQAVGDWSRYVPLLALAIPLAKIADDRIRGALGAEGVAEAIGRVASK